MGEEFTDDEIKGILYYFTSDTVTINYNDKKLTNSQIKKLIDDVNAFRIMTSSYEGKIGQFKIKLQKF